MFAGPEQISGRNIPAPTAGVADSLPFRQLGFAAAQLLLGPSALGNVACHLAEANERTLFISQCRKWNAGPEPCPIFAHAPPFVFNPAGGSSQSELFLWFSLSDVVSGI